MRDHAAYGRSPDFRDNSRRHSSLRRYPDLRIRCKDVMSLSSLPLLLLSISFSPHFSFSFFLFFSFFFFNSSGARRLSTPSWSCLVFAGPTVERSCNCSEKNCMPYPSAESTLTAFCIYCPFLLLRYCVICRRAEQD